jgi:hypothetical protein
MDRSRSDAAVPSEIRLGIVGTPSTIQGSGIGWNHVVKGIPAKTARNQIFFPPSLDLRTPAFIAIG